MSGPEDKRLKSLEEAKAENDEAFSNIPRFFVPGFGRPITAADLYSLGANLEEHPKGVTPIPLDDPHFAAIGKFVVNWAALELMMDSAIWQIARVPDDLGASLTAQIGSFDTKLRALGAILTVRGEFENIISALNKFSQGETRALLELRNRVVHDGWIGDLKTGIPHRLTFPSSKSSGTSTITYLQYSTTTLNQAVDRIEQLIEKFKEIIKPAIDRYPPLPLPQESS